MVSLDRWASKVLQVCLVYLESMGQKDSLALRSSGHQDSTGRLEYLVSLDHSAIAVILAPLVRKVSPAKESGFVALPVNVDCQDSQDLLEPMDGLVFQVPKVHVVSRGTTAAFVHQDDPVIRVKLVTLD